MAGSYKHIVNDRNEFRGVELLDHLGDAYEALEECYDMIQYLTGGDRRRIHEAWLHGHIRTRCAFEPDLTAGGVHTYERYWAPREDPEED